MVFPCTVPPVHSPSLPGCEGVQWSVLLQSQWQLNWGLSWLPETLEETAVSPLGLASWHSLWLPLLIPSFFSFPERREWFMMGWMSVYTLPRPWAFSWFLNLVANSEAGPSLDAFLDAPQSNLLLNSHAWCFSRCLKKLALVGHLHAASMGSLTEWWSQGNQNFSILAGFPKHMCSKKPRWKLQGFLWLSCIIHTVPLPPLY